MYELDLEFYTGTHQNIKISGHSIAQVRVVTLFFETFLVVKKITSNYKLTKKLFQVL